MSRLIDTYLEYLRHENAPPYEPDDRAYARYRALKLTEDRLITAIGSVAFEADLHFRVEVVTIGRLVYRYFVVKAMAEQREGPRFTIALARRGGLVRPEPKHEHKHKHVDMLA